MNEWGRERDANVNPGAAEEEEHPLRAHTSTTSAMPVQSVAYIVQGRVE